MTLCRILMVLVAAGMVMLAYPGDAFARGFRDGEVTKLEAYLKHLFSNPKIRVVPRPKKDSSAEVYISETFIGVLFIDDDDDRSFQFQMAILEEDLVEIGKGGRR